MLYTTCVLICVVFFNVSLICFECVLDVLSKLAEIGNVTASENVRRTENTEHTVEIQKIEKIHIVAPTRTCSETFTFEIDIDRWISYRVIFSEFLIG